MLVASVLAILAAVTRSAGLPTGTRAFALAALAVLPAGISATTLLRTREPRLPRHLNAPT